MKRFRAHSTASMLTLALFARPGMLPHTRPWQSAIASIVTHTILVSESSHQIVDSVIEENSFVNVMLKAALYATAPM